MNNAKPVKTPSRIRVRVDTGGITAINDRNDEIRYAISPSAHGFNPLELLSASLGVCTAINLRNELRAVGDAAPQFELAVECIKAAAAPSRVEQLEMKFHLPAAITGAVAEGVVQRAEAACTIANTLTSSARIRTA